MPNSTGNFILSFDFEKFWGVSDQGYDSSYLETNVKNVDLVFPEVLLLLDKYNVKCTVAVVGALFLDKNTLSAAQFRHIPYENQLLNPFRDKVHLASMQDALIFGGKAMESLLVNKNHEIGSHSRLLTAKGVLTLL